MAEIKELSDIVSKWQRRAGSAGTEYAEGVKNPKKDWATETAAAEGNYEAGLQKSISRKAFGKGVKKAGTSKWQQNSIEKGPARYAQGVSQAGDAYATGFAPFAQTIANTTLPPRGPKGDPNNIQRVVVIAKALHEKKISLEG